MEKEKVTEELVRQNGNQAAAVMADYAGQGGGGGGSTSGIPTIDRNTQPNIVWRQPTAEDSAKFKAGVSRVADLPEGKIPLLLITRDEGMETVDFMTVLSFSSPVEDNDGIVELAFDHSYLISEDWSLLGMAGVS